MIAGVVIFALIILAIGSLGSVGLYSSGGSSSEVFDDFNQEVEEAFIPKVTVHQVLDPWLPEQGNAGPSAGRRFVALEVTIEASKDGPGSVADPRGFKLTDSAQFAYGTLTAPLKTPALGGLELGPGEKTSGWVAFEIDESNEIESLSYLSFPVSLPR